MRNKATFEVVFSDSNSLSHHGVKGMKWGKHLFARNLGLSRFRMSPTMETDTGTGSANESLKAHMNKFFANRDAKFQKQLAESAAKREVARKAAAEEAAKKEASKKKKSSGSSKKSSSKADSSKEESKVEETKETKKPVSKTPDLPDELIEKIQDNNYQMTPDEIKQRSENGVAKAKELLAILSDDPTENEIYDLLKHESDKRGTGYDAFAIGIAIDTALVKLYDKQIQALSGKEGSEEQINDLKHKKELHETMLKESIATGKASY